jgi:hypothetical protein
MGMIYFLDNDVILKLTTYRMLDEALDCLEIERSDIRVLASARYFFGKNKGVKKKYSEVTIALAIEFVKSCTTISSQDNDEYRLLEKMDGEDFQNLGIAVAPNPESLAGLIVSKVASKYQVAEVFTAPQLPLNLLANAYKSWLKPDEKETVVALIDTSLWDDAKKGIAFTEQRIIWKEVLTNYDSLSYQDLSKLLESQGLDMIGNEEARKSLDKLHSIANLFTNEDDKNQFSAFVQQLGKGYLALTI